MSVNLFSVLGFSQPVPLKEVKTRYKELAKLYHPDVSKEPGAEEKFKIINNAYQELLKLDWQPPRQPKPKPPRKAAEQTIWRVLNEKQKSDHFTVTYPFKYIVKNSRFFFMLGMFEFEFLFEKKTELPAKITGRIRDRSITISIVEGYF